MGKLKQGREPDEEEVAAEMFRALGDPTRLQIIRFLRHLPVQSIEHEAATTDNAVTVSDICLHVTGTKKFTSTIAHHLKELRRAGLISMERAGKHKLCRLEREAFRALAGYLTDEEQGTEEAPVPEEVRPLIPERELVTLIASPHGANGVAAAAASADGSGGRASKS